MRHVIARSDLAGAAVVIVDVVVELLVVVVVVVVVVGGGGVVVARRRRAALSPRAAAAPAAVGPRGLIEVEDLEPARLFPNERTRARATRATNRDGR